MDINKAMAIVNEGVNHLEFAMEVFLWQHLRGKGALFEHPAPSKAWEEVCVEKILKLPGVRRVRADQCEFGLQTNPHEGLHRKPTDLWSTVTSWPKDLQFVVKEDMSINS